MKTTSDIAQEPFRMPTLPGWLQWQGNQGFYGRRTQTHGDHLCAELHFRRFTRRIYSVAPLTGNGGFYWVRPGDSPPSLRDYRTGLPAPENKRGETLSYYVAAFGKTYPKERLVAVLSFGDAGVNENRGLLMQLLSGSCRAVSACQDRGKRQ